eukprot:4490193-Amphidinium_carterae.1
MMWYQNLQASQLCCLLRHGLSYCARCVQINGSSWGRRLLKLLRLCMMFMTYAQRGFRLCLAERQTSGSQI